MQKCWFWNIDADSRDFFWKEIQAGRLRQGWGYDPKLDLRTMQAQIRNGQPLDDQQQIAWNRSGPMLDAIEQEDLIVVKNVPERGRFVLVRIVGGYEFDIPEEMGDFGHFLPCALVTCPFRMDAQVVQSKLARALGRERHPIRITYKHDEAVKGLAAISPEDQGREPRDSLDEALGGWRSDLAKELQKRIWERRDPREAELLVEMLLRHRFRGEIVVTAGPSERGADRVCDVPMGLGLTTRIAVQVKLHENESSDEQGLEQIRQALEAHAAQFGLYVCFADALADNVEAKLDEMRRTLNVEALYGDALYAELLAALSDPADDE